MSEATFTYQTRLQLVGASSTILDEYASLFGHVQRSLFAEIAKGASPLSLKNAYLTRFAITARQFNAIRVDTVGKIDSCKKLLPLQISNLQDRIESLKKKIEKLSKKGANNFSIHQKKRRLQNLQHRAKKLQSDQELGKVRLCFGSKKLFRAQFDLEKNSYQSHEEWKQDWDDSRNAHFFVLGSKDETAGNQSCVATLQEDGNLTLRLRLPNALAETYGKFLTITNVRFQYGHDNIVASLQSCLERKHAIKDKKDLGQAISYRFKEDKKGWIVFATTEMKKPKIITRNDLGAIGVDINADHLALVETDRFGNPIHKRTIFLNTYGKRTNQTLAIIGNACAEIVEWAEQTKKPIIHEQLDFQKKKTSLKENNYKKRSRMLSSLAYNRIITLLKAKAFRHGVTTYS
ncbi:MAG: IS200/IS605 family accessory protein TnpB-related protein, partial [Waddliaceae bacterium]